MSAARRRTSAASLDSQHAAPAIDSPAATTAACPARPLSSWPSQKKRTVLCVFARVPTNQTAPALPLPTGAATGRRSPHSAEHDALAEVSRSGDETLRARSSSSPKMCARFRAQRLDRQKPSVPVPQPLLQSHTFPSGVNQPTSQIPVSQTEQYRPPLAPTRSDNQSEAPGNDL